MKSRLNSFFKKFQKDEEGPIFEPSVTTLHKAPGPTAYLYLTRDQAFDIYAAHVAWALYLDYKAKVPWKLADKSPDDLEELLASPRFHSRIVPNKKLPSAYPPGIVPGTDFQVRYEVQNRGIMRSDPRTGYWFLTRHPQKFAFQQYQLLGSTERETVENLTTWCRSCLFHHEIPPLVLHPLSTDQMLANSQLDARLRLHAPEYYYPSPPPPPGSYGYYNPDRWVICMPNGCHSAAALLCDLARSVNIALRHVLALEDFHCDGKYLYSRVHAGVIYRFGQSDERILWHTDELYEAGSCSCDEIFPIDGSGAAAARRASLFEAWWQPFTQMWLWGFHCVWQEVDPTYAANELHASTADEDYYRLGFVAGYWRRSDRAELLAGTSGPLNDPVMKNDLMKVFQLDRWYQCGDWRLVMYYQGDNDDGVRYYNLAYGYQQRVNTSFVSFPMVRSTDDYLQRVEACITAWGGNIAPPVDPQTNLPNPNSGVAHAAEQELTWLDGRGYPLGQFL